MLPRDHLCQLVEQAGPEVLEQVFRFERVEVLQVGQQVGQFLEFGVQFLQQFVPVVLGLLLVHKVRDEALVELLELLDGQLFLQEFLDLLLGLLDGLLLLLLLLGRQSLLFLDQGLPLLARQMQGQHDQHANQHMDDYGPEEELLESRRTPALLEGLPVTVYSYHFRCLFGQKSGPVPRLEKNVTAIPTLRL